MAVSGTTHDEGPATSDDFRRLIKYDGLQDNTGFVTHSDTRDFEG